MSDNTTTSPGQKLAAEFSHLLREALSETDLIQVRARNRQQANPNICHSHDFIDANMVMAAAFINVFGREVDIDDDGDTDLWNGSWDLAKQRGFSE